jgi:hypothetical protein
VFPSEAERTFAATRIVQWIRDRRGIDRVSRMSRIAVPASEIRSNRNLTRLNERLAQTTQAGSSATAGNIALLTGGDLTRLRPAVSVRSAGDFRWKVALALALTLGPMWLIHLIRRQWTGIGEPLVIPGVTLLLGLGLIAMLTLRDPIRDGDIAISFATGVCLGAIGLVVMVSLDVVRIAQTLSPYRDLRYWRSCLRADCSSLARARPAAAPRSICSACSPASSCACSPSPRWRCTSGGAGN